MKIYGQRAALLLALLPLCAFDPFRRTNSHVESGNAQLQAGKVKEALEQYDQAARELPDDPGVHYNRGIALQRLGQGAKAQEAFLRATAAADKDLQARSFFNLGNTYFEQKAYKEAVAAYVRSLQLRPGHRPTQWNLELALRRLLEEQQKQQKEQDKKADQQKQQDKEKKDEQNKQQDKQDGKEQKDKESQKKQQKDGQGKTSKPEAQQAKQAKQQPAQASKPQPQGGQRPKPKPAEEEREAVLNALDRSDKSLQRQRARMMVGGGVQRPEKDW